jgi:hypothetical protein
LPFCQRCANFFTRFAKSFTRFANFFAHFANIQYPFETFYIQVVAKYLVICRLGKVRSCQVRISQIVMSTISFLQFEFRQYVVQHFGHRQTVVVLKKTIFAANAFFLLSRHTQCILSHLIHNSTAMYVSLKTLYPGRIQTRVFSFLRRMRHKQSQYHIGAKIGVKLKDNC